MQVKINGFEMNYETAGPQNAPVVLLHHPLATNLSTWDELTADLSPRYRVIRMDARGHGKSQAPSGPYDLDTLAQDMISLMDHLGVQRAHFLGLSMGGMVGQYLGLQHGSRFISLVHASTTSRIPDEAQPVWDQRIADAKAGGMNSQVEGAMGRWVSPEGRKNAAVVARLSRMIEATPVEGYLGWCEAIRRLNVTHRLGSINVPSKVIVGELDPSTTVAAAQTIHKGIPGSEIAIVPGVSHMLHNEQPSTFNAQVLPFLDKHAKT